MAGPHLIYFADPMCSWCWGFSPVIGAIAGHFGAGLPVRLILGGLRPGTTKPMNEAAKASTRAHWQHVHDASGQPFDFAFFDRDHFVYDTEPASRAVVLAKQRGMETGLAMLHNVQEAFYAKNQDVTSAAVLTSIAAGLGFDAEEFRAAFNSRAALNETQADFAIARKAGVHGFPTLIAGTGEGNPYTLITNGFQPAARVLPALDRWLEEASASIGS